MPQPAPLPPSLMSSITPRLHHMLCSGLAFISGLVEFPGQLRNTSQTFYPPTFPYTLDTPTSSIIIAHDGYQAFSFPDCGASVHKSCRDSLPSCAKVKVKVCARWSAPPPLTTGSDSLFVCLSDQLPKQQPSVPDPSSAATVTMRNKCEFSSKPPHQFQFQIRSSNLYLSRVPSGRVVSTISLNDCRINTA